MKNNLKKIIAGVGIGTMLAGGAFLTTGCTADLSQDQMSKIMQTVDNADKFMEEGVNYFNLEDRLTREDILAKYNGAVGSFMLNKDNILDNVTVTTDGSDSNALIIVQVFKKSSGESVMLQLRKDLESGETEVIDYKDSTQHPDESADRKSYLYYRNCLMFGTDDAKFHKLTADEIVECKILENGNIAVTAFTYKFFGSDEMGFVIFELLPNGTFAKLSYRVIEYVPVGTNPTGDNVILDQVEKEHTFVYEYNKLTETEIDENIQKYNKSNN